MDSSPIVDDKVFSQFVSGLCPLIISLAGFVFGLIALIRPSWLRQETQRRESGGDEKASGTIDPFVTTGNFRTPLKTSTPGNPFLDSYQARASPSFNPFETQPTSTSRESCSASFLPNSPNYAEQDRVNIPSRTNPFSQSAVMSDSSFMRRKERVPETFSGSKTELKDWLVQFEIVSRYNAWTEAEKGSNLASSLRGNAQQVLRDLPEEQVEDYHSILEALKRRFDPGEKENLRRQEFRYRIKKRDESVTEYGFALNRLANSAYPTMPREAKEILVVDRFVDGLPSIEMQKHVQFRHPSNLNEAIAFAIEYESFEGRLEGRKPAEKAVRNIAKKEDNDILKALKDIADGQKVIADQLKTRPQPRPSAFPTFFPGIECHECHQEGHYRNACPNRPRNQGNGRYAPPAFGPSNRAPRPQMSGN